MSSSKAKKRKMPEDALELPKRLRRDPSNSPSLNSDDDEPSSDNNAPSSPAQKGNKKKKQKIAPPAPNPYTKADSSRDDKAYSAGRSAFIQQQRQQKQQQGAPKVPVNDLKNKIRDLKRLLERKGETLPVDVRIEKERALKGYERDLGLVQSKKDMSKLIKKYHFVRFLERKTATKHLRRLLRRQQELTTPSEDSPQSPSQSPSSSSEETLASLEKQIHTARVDLNYTIYSPLTEKYISLYPSQKGSGKSQKQGQEQEDTKEAIEAENGESVAEKEKKEKPPLWFAVERSMADGTLELLRDGRLGIGAAGEKKEEEGQVGVDVAGLAVGKKEKKEKSKDKKAGKEKETKASKKSHGSKQKDKDGDADMASGAGDESDGGFFEE
ncbi:hypothetical protein AJ80_07064 [Polytolypa hystricis UAMH7299]|uniref:rRNA-processing protein EFG1 n=1 Tax=Polytolypa hystricis (strain UAMH7299) TaxID=1447883 RepID=A0A2B7XIN9_POLH7|nr:hypothetical protein AJ80_07064 [Polytolypa hystricis UAMH7299]